MKILISIQGVSFQYGKTDSKRKKDIINLSLNIQKGECLLFCGLSGCGKTTMTRLINGLVPHYYDGKLSGKVFLEGKPIIDTKLYELSEHVGSVFQNPRSQFFNVDTQSELVFACENRGMKKEEIALRLDKTVKEFEIGSELERSLFEMSGGEKQKVACASVHTAGTEVVVLDEPSSNLDMHGIRTLKKTLKAWKKEGKTIIIAEHRLHYLMDVVDRIVYMERGDIILDSPVGEFYTHYEKNSARWGLRAIRMSDFMNSFVLNKSFDVKNYGKREDFDEQKENAMLILKDINVTYDRKTRIDIKHLSLPAGEIIGIIGNNGSGKSTLLHSLCGLETKAKGEIQYKGKHYRKRKRQKLAYLVMQDVNHQLFTESVFDEVILSMEEPDDEKAFSILGQLDLVDKKDRHPLSLSGGEKQRVAIASAIASNRGIIAFDEPTSGLDYKHMRQVSTEISDLQSQGKTVVLTTHDPELLCQVCTYVVCIEKGQVKWAGSPFETKAHLESYFSV